MNVNAIDESLMANPPARPWRSVWAVFAGLLVNFILSMGTDTVLHAMDIYPRQWFQPMETHLWVLALAYRLVFAVVGGWVSARLAPSAAMKHVAVLMGLGVVFGVIGVAANWNKGPEFGPHWFMLGIIVTGLPCTWLGGWLFVRRGPRSQR